MASAQCACTCRRPFQWSQIKKRVFHITVPCYVDRLREVVALDTNNTSKRMGEVRLQEKTRPPLQVPQPTQVNVRAIARDSSAAPCTQALELLSRSLH